MVGKIFDENSIEKLNFYFTFIFILENLLLKIEPLEITSFSTTIFSVSGGGVSPFPLATPLIGLLEIIQYYINISIPKTNNEDTENFHNSWEILIRIFLLKPATGLSELDLRAKKLE